MDIIDKFQWHVIFNLFVQHSFTICYTNFTRSVNSDCSLLYSNYSPLWTLSCSVSSFVLHQTRFNFARKTGPLFPNSPFRQQKIQCLNCNLVRTDYGKFSTKYFRVRTSCMGPSDKWKLTPILSPMSKDSVIICAAQYQTETSSDPPNVAPTLSYL